jgi:DNA-binding PadR family transcriptional regulator
VEKGFVTSYQGQPTRRRGGRSKRFYEITRQGMEVLGEMRQVQKILWKDFPEMQVKE